VREGERGEKKMENERTRRGETWKRGLEGEKEEGVEQKKSRYKRGHVFDPNLK
jgi:hypothetical protein